METGCISLKVYSFIPNVFNITYEKPALILKETSFVKKLTILNTTNRNRNQEIDKKNLIFYAIYNLNPVQKDISYVYKSLLGGKNV